MTQKLLNWLDSEDCHIDQYAIQQVKDKIHSLEELEVPVAGVTDEELPAIDFDTNSEIGSTHWFNTLAGQIKRMGEFIHNHPTSPKIKEADYGLRIQMISAHLMQHYTSEIPLDKEELLKQAKEALEWCMSNMKPDRPELQSDAFNIPANAIDGIERILGERKE